MKATICAMALACTAMLVGCPRNIPTPIPDAGDASVSVDAGQGSDGGVVSCAAACANLVLLGCEEGKNAACAATCEHVHASSIIDFSPACVTAASDVASVRKCPGIICQYSSGR